MRIYYVYYFLLFNVFINCEVRFVFELFRHGARSPYGAVNEYNVDIFGYEWPGKGELTYVGMRQHYLLGHRNRMRYKDFLSSSFNSDELYVVSTDYNRTIQSAQSQLQGMFPPSTGPELFLNQTSLAIPPVNDSYYKEEQSQLGIDALSKRVQVFPIHIFDKDAHDFEITESHECPGIKKYEDENKQRKEIPDFMAKFNATYGEAILTALKINNSDYFFHIPNLDAFADVYCAAYTNQNDLSVLSNQGVNLKELYNSSIEFLYINMFIIYFGDKEKIVGTMSMSPTMRDVVTWMEKRIKFDLEGKGYLGYSSPKMVIYSAHDTNVAPLQVYMNNLFNTTMMYTHYASNVFFELYRPDGVDHAKLSDEDYYVLYIYNDNIMLNITFNEFRDKVRSNSWTQEQINSFCHFTSSDSTKSESLNSALIVTTIIFGCTTLALGLYVLIKSCKKKTVTSDGFHSLMNK